MKIRMARAVVEVEAFEDPRFSTPDETISNALSRVRGVGDGEIDFHIVTAQWHEVETDEQL